jgi:hypothetical protein
MSNNPIIRDLGLATLAKIAAIAVIYWACFAVYDGRPVDTATHLLGPAPVSHLQGS